MLVAPAFVAVLFVMTAVPAAHASPNFETILRKAPGSEHTDADTLTWLLTFTEPVTNVDPTDFVVSGTTATLAMQPLALDEEGCSRQWDAALSGGDLTDLNGMVTLTVSEDQEIWGCLGDGEVMTHPGPNDTNDNTFVVANAKSAQESLQSATFTVTFQGNWTTASTPGGVVSGAHFTTLIGAVHNDMVTFWESGGTATAGVENVAELGITGTFKSEINANSNAISVIQKSVSGGGTGSATFNVTVTNEHPLITLLSMIGPSPDWFVGVSGRSLLDMQGDWESLLEVDLFPYDAGTEDGTEFSLSNSATSPQGVITSIKGMGKFSNVRMARLTFTRQSINTAPSFTGDAGFEADENQTAAGTVVATDPDSGDEVAYAITGGADASKFDVGETTGVLRFKVPPSYERAADVASTDPVNGAGNNEYLLTVTASGGTGDRAMTAEQTITVTVGNLEEAGTVSFSKVGTEIRAKLSDPDGGVSSPSWQWARSSDRSTGWANISGATSAGYSPSGDDEEMYLRARVSYSDGQGSGKQAQGVSAYEITPPKLLVSTLVSGLSIPWDLAFTPDGTLLFTQRAGVLSARLSNGTVETIDAELGDLFANGETGLMGIVVDPDFASNRRFYTCQGHTGPEVQVIAWTIDAAYTTATRVADPLVGGIPAATGGRHGGCRLRFGPEGYLWIATGDAASGTVPQDLSSLGGKVLRVDSSTGAGAPANPFASSPRIYTYGHRNVQGLALRPGTSRMWSVEHGPSVDDEINLLVAGRNYGWDPVPGYNEAVSMTNLVKFPEAIEAKWSSGSPTLAPSGGIFLEGEQWGVWEERLAVATLKDRKLRLFEFTPDGELVSQVVVPELDGAFVRLRTPMMGPDGALYVTTSNGGGNDRILRIVKDDAIPVTLKLTPDSIGEKGGVSRVTASLERTSNAVTTVMVSAEAVAPAVPDDFTLSENGTLTIAAGRTSSTGEVTVGAVDNKVDAPNKAVTVTATAENINGVTPPSAVTLTINDDDASPVVTTPSPILVAENRTVVATLTATDTDRPAQELMWAIAAGTDRDQFMLTAGGELTFATAKDYEDPDDANGDGDYEVTVRVSDGANPVEAALTVRLRDVDDTAPVFSSATVNGTTLALTYDETLDGGSTPEAGDFTVTGGDRARTVTRAVVRGTVVELTLDPGAEHQEAGIRVSYTPGTKPIRDVPGNEAEALSQELVTNDTPDTTAPEVSSLEITSNPGSDRTYAAEDTIEVTVTFSETVEVEGTPRLRLRVGARTRTAGYLRGTGTAALVFGYEVAYGDEDSDGVSIQSGRIALNGGTFRDEADNPAELVHEAVSTQAGHKVDGVRPAYVSAAVDGASMTLTYGEALDGGSRPAPGDFTVEVGGSGRSVTGVSVSGSVVTLTLNPAVEHGDTGIRVSYTVPTGAGANPIRDAVGNEAVALSNRSVTNTTDAPNTAPEIRSSSSISVPENKALAMRLAARDTDPGDEVTGWAIVGGADQGQFSITSDMGELSFRTAPDFEDPGDAASSDPVSGAEDSEYVVRVRVRSGAGARELEAEQTLTVRVTDQQEPPGIPEAPTFSGETAESLIVNWSEPDNTGPEITDYDVQYREKDTGRFTDGGHQGPGLTLTINDLKAGTVYEVQVRAKNDEGTSGWSDSGEGMTITPLTLEMMTMEEPPVSGPLTVRFSFSEAVTGFNRFDIETEQDPACTDDQNNTVFCDPDIGVLETVDERVFTTTVSPWTDRMAHSYTLRLTVEEDAVRSSVGNKGNEQGMLEVRVSPPGAPEPISSMGLRASSGSGSVRLSWNRPSEDGGSPIIRYEYRFAPAGEAWSEWENVGAGTRGVTVGNLVNGREYVFEVRAVNALGKGGAETAGATPELRIAPPPPRGGGGGGGGGGLLFPPQAPAGLMAMPAEGAVRLEWSPPDSDGGTPILRYEYRLKEGRGGFGEWTPIEDSAPDEVNASGYTVGELGNGTVYVFELRAVNLVGKGRVSEAVEVVMGLDRAYWSNFLAGDLQGSEASLERGPFGNSPQRLRLRFGAGLRFEEDELDEEGEVRATRLGGYGYRYTSHTMGELRLDYDEGESCGLRMTFRGVGAGSYSYRCGGALQGQGSFRLTGLNRGPEITSTGPFEVVENQAMVVQLEAVDPDEGDGIEGYGIAGGADGGLFAVVEETGELMFREAPDYEDPSDVESGEPASGAADNEYIVVVEVRSGEGERERKGSRAIRVRVSDEEEPPEITGAGVFEVAENTLRVGRLEAVDPDAGDEIGGYGIAGGADGALFAVEATGELMFREAPDYEDPSDVENAEPQSPAGDNEYIVVVEVRSGEGERERKGSRAIRVRVSDEEEPPEITGAGVFEVVENLTRVGQLEAVDQDKQDEITGYGIAGGADGGLFAVEAETGELLFREAPDYETPGDVASDKPQSGAADNEYIVVVEVSSGEGERERKGSRAIRVRVSDEEEPPEITSLGPFEVVENRTRVGQLEAVDQDKQDEITGYGIAGGADGGLFAVEAETGELMFREAPDYETPGDVASDDPQSGAGDNEYIVVVEVSSGEGERERRGSRAIRVRVSDEEEPPGAPAAPVVTAEGSDSLKVSWREPENRGPEIVDYGVRYRESGEEGYSDGGHQGTGLEVRLSGLKEGTAYEVQVRAVNEEGIGEWSEPGEGRTETEDPDPDDPSDFTEGDLEGRRLTLRLEGGEGTAGSLELRFGEGNRFEQIESGSQQAATRSEGAASRSGSYTYERTGPGMGTVRLAYDDGSSCEVLLVFTESGAGTFSYDCGQGDPAEGSFRLTTGSLFVPVILSSAGRNQSFFTSELTLTNRGDREARLDYTYTAHIGGGSGRASDLLAPGMQKIETDALGYLQSLGIAIPETGNRIGTLRVEARLGSEVEAVVRTTTEVPEGRAGLAYLGVAEEEGFQEPVYLCGLRQNSRDRSNLALQNMGAPEEEAITLRATVYSGEASDTSPRVLEDITLEPGGFHQYNQVLDVLGSTASGYVKVERVEGTAPFYAYGVINDQANSDGSFVFPVTASSLEGTAGQTLPVIVETSAFTSELTVTNFSEEARVLHFSFVAEGVRTPDRTAEFALMPMRLEAGEQRILPDIVDILRGQGVEGIGPSRGGYAGPVFATAEGSDMSGIVMGARTGSQGGGGQYSVFYNAVPEGGAFTEVAWVDGLQQNQENRSNLALVNTGEVDDSESVFHLEIYDGETGLLAETVVTGPIPPRGWHQINGILAGYAPETRQGYIRIEKVSGENPFLAYGVVNDGGAPGERSGDGAYLPARE